jgi:tetratricopeptide (TPR) repeat protein
LYERDQLWKRLGERPQKRLHELEKHRALIERRDDLSVELCALYNQTGRSAEALRLVRERQFQPWEGGEGGPLGQYVRAHLALGRAALATEDFTCAREHFALALTPPRNLGEAGHLLANQSDIHYWLGCAFSSLGQVKSAREHWTTAANFKGDFQAMSVRAFSEMTYFSAKALEQLGKKSPAAKLFRDLQAFATQMEKSPAKIDYFATSLPSLLLFEDDLQFRQETTALFLQAQAAAGLGQIAQSSTLLKTVLKRDPNHALAADFLLSLKPAAHRHSSP